MPSYSYISPTTAITCQGAMGTGPGTGTETSRTTTSSLRTSDGSCRRAWRATQCLPSSGTPDTVPRPADSCACQRYPPPPQRTACVAPACSPPSEWPSGDCRRPCHHHRPSCSCRLPGLKPHPPSSRPCWTAPSGRWPQRQPSCPPPSTGRGSLSFFYL